MEIWHDLQFAACGNGNLLLSWGMKWNGEWDQKQERTICKVGSYLRKYGESIYRTHGGPWLPKEWGGSTFREDTVYIHVCNPQVREILLPKVNGVDLALDKVLTGQKVEFRSSATNIQIRFHSVEADKPFVMRLIASRSLHPDDIIRE